MRYFLFLVLLGFPLFAQNVSENVSLTLQGKVQSTSNKKQIDGNILYNNMTRIETNTDGSKDIISYDSEGNQQRDPLYGDVDFSVFNQYNALLDQSDQQLIIQTKIAAIPEDKAVTGLGTVTNVLNNSDTRDLFRSTSATQTGRTLVKYQQETIDSVERDVLYVAERNQRKISRVVVPTGTEDATTTTIIEDITVSSVEVYVTAFDVEGDKVYILDSTRNECTSHYLYEHTISTGVTTRLRQGSSDCELDIGQSETGIIGDMAFFSITSSTTSQTFNRIYITRQAPLGSLLGRLIIGYVNIEDGTYQQLVAYNFFFAREFSFFIKSNFRDNHRLLLIMGSNNNLNIRDATSTENYASSPLARTIQIPIFAFIANDSRNFYHIDSESPRHLECDDILDGTDTDVGTTTISTSSLTGFAISDDITKLFYVAGDSTSGINYHSLVTNDIPAIPERTENQKIRMSDLVNNDYVDRVANELYEILDPLIGGNSQQISDLQAKTTLSDLDCTNDQVAKYNNTTSAWECTDQGSGGTPDTLTVSGQTITVPSGKTLSDYSSIQIEFTAPSINQGASSLDYQVETIPIQILIASSRNWMIQGLGQRGADFYALRMQPVNIHETSTSFTVSLTNVNDGSNTNPTGVDVTGYVLDRAIGIKL